jgi:hypothetical protein
MSAVLFSPEQLRASLWAGRAARVHAVIDGLVVPGIAARLRTADTGGWDCLQRGALSPEAESKAAFLAELKENSPFTDWLIDVATPTYPGWGVLLVSKHALLPVREHCRSLAEVLTPDGERRRWRWHDADVLRELLPVLQSAQLDELFALGQSVIVPTSESWTWFALERGALASETRHLMQPAR